MQNKLFTTTLLTLLLTATLSAASAPAPVITSARLVTQTQPTYPAQARQARLEGKVAFNITIARDGSVRDIQLVSGHPMLVPAAEQAIRQWRYTPTLLDGRAIDMATRVELNFALIR